MSTDIRSNSTVAREGFIPVDHAELYYREVGTGRPILILHGGPDFDHSYLLPDMDRLSDVFRLLYYDQRGRGKSGREVQPQDVSLESEVDDLDCVRKYFGLETVPLLGHSWGALLALEYALRHPEHVSHLILLNTAPVSRADYLLLRKDRREKTPADIEELIRRSAEPKYKAGDPDTVAEYYRVHFRSTIRQAAHLEQVIQSMRSSFTQEGILKVRAVEKRLYEETWYVDEYELPARLRELHIPTLVIHGDYDFVPLECAAHIAQSIPNTRLVVLKDTGHFSYVESWKEVKEAIEGFI